MKSVELLNLNDYRDQIKLLLKLTGIKQADLAVKLGVQKSFLSRVFAKDLHFNSDHMYQIFQDTELHKDYVKFIQLTYEANRSGLHERSEGLLKTAKAIRKKLLGTKENLQKVETPKLDPEAVIEYLNTPNCLILNLYLSTLNHNQVLIDQIKRDLDMDQDEIWNCLEIMEKCDLIKAYRAEKQFKIVKRVLHMEKDSPLTKAWTQSIRLKSLFDPKCTRDASSNLTITMSLDEEKRKSIQTLTVDYIKKIQETCLKETDAPITEIWQFNLDFFPWFQKKQ